MLQPIPLGVFPFNPSTTFRDPAAEPQSLTTSFLAGITEAFKADTFDKKINLGMDPL